MKPGSRTAAMLLALALMSEAGTAQTVPEPDGYRTENYRAPTPATLQGAKILDTWDAASAWRTGAAGFIDVLPRSPKPANLPPGTVWRETPRDSVPKATWLPNVGYGALSPEAEAYFRRGLEAVTGGDPGKLLVFFCLRDCWMSWNAARRALSFGYRDVAWFPDGTDGWSAAELPLQRVEPWQ